MSNIEKIDDYPDYPISIKFNSFLIEKITITDHYKLKRSDINNELILKIIEINLNNKFVDHLPNSYQKWGRNVFRFETYYQNKNYRLIFWFKDGTNNHLWVRNCHRID